VSTEPRPRRRAIGHACAAAVAFAFAGLWVTRPLGAHLLDHSLVAYPYTAFDVPLNAWVLSWVSRTLVTQPWALFQANIYHPTPDALAYTEHMLGSAPFFAPAFLATGNPALALNVMILAGLVLSAIGTYWVTWRWTASPAAAAFAGLVVGFSEPQVRALGPNLQTTQYLPFVLLLLDRVLGGGGTLATIGLAAALTGQSLASYYYAYPTMLATGAAIAVVCVPRATRPSGAALARVVLALAATAAVLALVSVPYFRVAAHGTDTVYTMTRLYEQMPGRLAHLGSLIRERSGFPAAVLALVGVLAATLPGTSAPARRRVLVLVAWVLVALLLAAGPTLRVGGRELTMPDRLLDRWAPGFAALRDRRRLFIVAPAAIGVLAGFGIVALARTQRRPHLAAGALALLALAATAARMNLGPCRLMPLPTGEQVAPIHRALARRDPGPVLELPVGAMLKDIPSATINTWYEYFSIFHWRPLVNGYASYWPPSLEVTLAMARGLPAARALQNLTLCTGVRWIVAHTASMAPEERESFLGSNPGLQLVERHDDDLLLEALASRDTAAGACAPLWDAAATATVEGTPLAALPPATRRVAIESVALPRELVRPTRPVAVAVPVRIRNTGTATWPGVALDETYIVRLSYTWRSAAGDPWAIPWRLWTRLPIDVRPGEAVEVPLAVRLPPQPGDYRLEVVVRQGLQETFEVSGPASAPSPILVR
jgi:hypothetical protein